MLRRSLPRLTLLAGTLTVTALATACGLPDVRPEGAGTVGRVMGPPSEAVDVEDDSDDAGDEALQVVPGTEAEAQALVDEAERRFLEEPSAEFEVRWIAAGSVEWPIEGSFDIEQPATEMTFGLDDDNRYELRLRGEDTWMQVTVDGRSMDCWMHLTGGAEDGGPAGVPYQALLLLEPVALGRKVLTDEDRASEESGYADVGDRVVVELRLDEALPAVIPQPGGLAATPIDPRATVRGVAVVGVGGRYLTIEYAAADVFDALAASRGGVPKELQALVSQPVMRELEVEIGYHDYGSPLEVHAPPRTKVADFGSWSDLLAGLEDPAARDPGSAPSCDAALRGT